MLNIDNLETYNNAELFTELERLTVLVNNVRKTIDTLSVQEDAAPNLLSELRLYLNVQTTKLGTLQRFIISGRQQWDNGRNNQRRSMAHKFGTTTNR